MDLIKLTRELGAAIQQDERYLKFSAAAETVEKDEEVIELRGQLQLLQMNYQREASQENPDSEKLANYEKDFNALYTKFMENSNMAAFDEAKAEIDSMMNYIMQILALCVNGADPATCEPEHEHNCDGSCSECSGCH